MLRYSLSGTNYPNILGLIDRKVSYFMATTSHRATLGMFTVGHKEDMAKKHSHASLQTSLLWENQFKILDPIVQWSGPSYFHKRPKQYSWKLWFNINSFLGDFHLLFMFIFYGFIVLNFTLYFPHVTVNEVIDEVCSIKVMYIFIAIFPRYSKNFKQPWN